MSIANYFGITLQRSYRKTVKVPRDEASSGSEKRSQELYFENFLPQPRGQILNGSYALWKRRRFQLCALRSEEHTSELQSRGQLVCRLLLEKKKTRINSRNGG